MPKKVVTHCRVPLDLVESRQAAESYLVAWRFGFLMFETIGTYHRPRGCLIDIAGFPAYPEPLTHIQSYADSNRSNPEELYELDGEGLHVAKYFLTVIVRVKTNSTSLEGDIGRVFAAFRVSKELC